MNRVSFNMLQMARAFVVLLFLMNSSFANTPWVVGLVADTSTVARASGLAISKGLQLAIDEINENGGLLGRPLVLEVLDHRTNPARGVVAVEELLDRDDLLVIIAGGHSHVALKTLSMIENHPVIMLGPWASATNLVRAGDVPSYFFRLSVRDEWAAEFILEQAQAQNCSRLGAILVLNDWGRSNFAALQAASEVVGVSINRLEWITRNSKKVPLLVQSMIEDGIDCLAFVSGTEDAVTLTTEIAKYPEAKRPAILAHWAVSAGDLQGLVSPDVIDKVDIKVLSTLDIDQPKTEKGEQFASTFLRRFGAMDNPKPFQGSAHAYDILSMYALVVEQQGTADASVIRDALKRVDRFDGVMKAYQQPFSGELNEALTQDDYVFLQYKNAP